MSNYSSTDLFAHGHDGDVAGSDALAPMQIDELTLHLNDATVAFDARRRPEVERLAGSLLQWRGDELAAERCALLSRTCFYFQRIGCAFDGVPFGHAARELAARLGLTNLERRASNVLSVSHLDNANFEEACRCLERSLTLARELDDAFLMSLAYSTTGLLFKEMGCYLDALAVIDRSLADPIATPEAEQVRFTSATNGLFCAHRLQDDASAMRYMSIATGALSNPLIDLVTRAAFEFNRAIYLLKHDDVETAETLIDAALAQLSAVDNPRAEILLATADALCDWASRVPERVALARRKLRDLYHRSRQTHLYHDDVLRALMQVHSRPASREDAETGVAYAKELVEYTTSVKHAKFYRQMSGQQAAAAAPGSAAPETQVFDPLTNARRWLDDDAIAPPLGDAGRTDLTHDIRKHDELTAIHDDLATMRTASLKTSIRTVAYDVAENWALAAEFFDDQTGQHCFRVGRLAGLLAAEIGKDDEYCVRIEHAARLHDIGKITVNELILLKPGPLDPNELTAMRTHAEVGGFLLQYADDPTLRMAAVIARHHHEWWNGAGYPQNLAGERIPLEARICALADVYDALTNARPYKRAWPHRTSVEQMVSESGVHFDPRLMPAFLRVLEGRVGSAGVPPPPLSTQIHLADMEANGLLVSRRKLMQAIDAN